MMYTFFGMFGFIFISMFATLTNYIYDIFPMNKYTNFLYQLDNKGIWGKISVTVFPILLWSLVELPILGNNSNFLIGVIINILVSCAVIFEIKYGIGLLINKENNTINLISIYIATLIGQLVSYMIFKMDPFFQGNHIMSILGMVLLLNLYIIVIIKPPKIEFFKGK